MGLPANRWFELMETQSIIVHLDKHIHRGIKAAAGGDYQLTTLIGYRLPNFGKQGHAAAIHRDRSLTFCREIFDGQGVLDAINTLAPSDATLKGKCRKPHSFA
jgi:hypothetical protein